MRKLFPGIDVNSYTVNEQIINDGEVIKKRLFVDYKFVINGRVVFVEYNGLQHYESVQFGSKATDLKKQIIRDEWLRNYCKKNNIILVEIDGRKYTGCDIKVFLIEKFTENKILVSDFERQM